jgi:DNA-binding response OmpR family regulator
MDKKPVVLALDDEKKITELLKAYLERAGFETICSNTGRDALAIIERAAPDILLLDLMLPDISGETICRKVRENSSVPIIMLTARVDEESIIRGLTMGADDYITKPFSPKQVVARVRAALRRSGIAASKKTRLKCGALEIDTETRQVTKDGAALSLSAQEYKMLDLFMSGSAKIWTRDEIIDDVKGDDFDGFDRTIDTQKKNIRKKIEDDPKNPRYIQTVYGLGYRFIGDVK